MARSKQSYHSTERTRKGAITTFGSRTDVGCTRDHNEDSLYVKPPLFVVCDGMGGHAAGEVASEIAVNVIGKHAPEHPDADALGKAVEEANRAIIDAALANPVHEGMGTTCTAAMLEGEQLVIAQVGDSRAYLLHEGRLQQLTRDHSLMANMIEAGQITPEEARVHPQRSVITRALGNDPATRPDLYEINVVAGDRLLLCSDGLSSMVLDQDIEAVMKRVPDPQRCASQLVNEAIAAGGYDNVTVIVADIEGKRAKQQKKIRRRTKFMVGFVLALLVVIIAGAAWGGYTYVHHVAYLANNNGKVAIYQGIPGDVFGISYHELVETSDVSVGDLPTGTQEHLNDGLRVDSVEDAQNLIQEYKSDIKSRAQESAAASASSSASSSSASSTASSASSATTSTSSTGR